LPEVNIDGLTGYTSNIGDVDKMAADSLTILKDENLAQFKAQAKEHSLKYKLKNILPLYQALY
jgi:hypothetical protein